MDRAVQKGIVPPATGIDEDGNKIWRLESIGEFFGLSEREIKEGLQEFELDNEIRRIDPATIQRIH
jgi:hypothetical protein